MTRKLSIYERALLVRLADRAYERLQELGSCTNADLAQALNESPESVFDALWYDGKRFVGMGGMPGMKDVEWEIRSHSIDAVEEITRGNQGP